jgi:hypothetical protein
MNLGWREIDVLGKSTGGKTKGEMGFRLGYILS